MFFRQINYQALVVVSSSSPSSSSSSSAAAAAASRWGLQQVTDHDVDHPGDRDDHVTERWRHHSPLHSAVSQTQIVAVANDCVLQPTKSYATRSEQRREVTLWSETNETSDIIIDFWELRWRVSFFCLSSFSSLHFPLSVILHPFPFYSFFLKFFFRDSSQNPAIFDFPYQQIRPGAFEHNIAHLVTVLCVVMIIQFDIQVHNHGSLEAAEWSTSDQIQHEKRTQTAVFS